MFGANPKRSQETIELLQTVFSRNARGREGFTVVYGYSPAAGLSKRPTNYVLGFSVRDRELVVIPMSPSGEAMGETLFLKAGDGTAFRAARDGTVTIDSPQAARPLNLVVPPSSLDSSALDGLRPVNQYENAANFLSFVRSI